MSRLIVFFLTLLATSSFAAAAELDIPVAYDLKVRIEPAQGMVAVRGTIVVPVQRNAQNLTFGLHRTFIVESLTVDGQKAAFNYQSIAPTPMNPVTRNVAVRLPPGTAQDGTVRIGLVYRGRMEKVPEWGMSNDQQRGMDDQVNMRLVELASYSSWYPRFFAFGRTLAIEMEVSLPKGWTAVSAGAMREVPARDGRAVTHWKSPRNIDIVISAAPNFRKTEGRAAQAAIEIYDTQMPAELIAREAADLSAVMNLFARRLGETEVPGGTVRHVYTPMVHGMGRAGIARLGLIVTSEGRVKEARAKNPDYSLFQDIAHEIGHFWWNFGKGQGDWINEASAEYFSALAVRDIVSQAEFEKVLARYRRNVAKLDPGVKSLATVQAEGGDFIVRYYKGSLMLNDLRELMGDPRFFEAAKTFFQTFRQASAGTADFRAFWGARLGDRRTRLDAWLDEAGGAPHFAGE
jgi:hypothetical protein